MDHQPVAREVAQGMLAIALRYPTADDEHIVQESIRANVLTPVDVATAPIAAYALARAASKEAKERHEMAAHLAGGHARLNATIRELFLQDPREEHRKSHERSPHLNHVHPDDNPNQLYRL